MFGIFSFCISGHAIYPCTQVSVRNLIFYSRWTHQILADKNPDEHSEEEAADEPEDREGIKLLWVGPSVLSWLLIGQLTSKFHGVIKPRQVLLEASTWGATEVVRCTPLPLRPLSETSNVIFQGHSGWLAGVWQGGAPSFWGGSAGVAAVSRSLRQEGRWSLRSWGQGPRLCPVEIKVKAGFCWTPGGSCTVEDNISEILFNYIQPEHIL